MPQMPCGDRGTKLRIHAKGKCRHWPACRTFEAGDRRQLVVADIQVP